MLLTRYNPNNITNVKWKLQNDNLTLYLALAVPFSVARGNNVVMFYNGTPDLSIDPRCNETPKLIYGDNQNTDIRNVCPNNAMTYSSSLTYQELLIDLSGNEDRENGGYFALPSEWQTLRSDLRASSLSNGKVIDLQIKCTEGYWIYKKITLTNANRMS